MRLPGKKVLRQGWRRWRGRRRPHGLILGYHRVTDAVPDPFDLSVTQAAFETQLAVLARRARIVALPQLLNELRTGAIPHRTVALTFDDGYDDTMSTVIPILERHALPATIFVTSGNLGSPYWWDVLASATLEPATLPAQLTLCAPAGVSSWSGSDRGALLVGVADLLRPLEAPLRDQLLGEVVSWSGATIPTSPCALTFNDLTTLAAHPLITLGAHSVTHPPLAGLPEAEQAREISDCVATMMAAGVPTPCIFSYPHGSFDATTQGLLRAAGFQGACCSDPDVATAQSDPLALPRLWVDGTQRGPFDRWLAGWL